MEILYTIILLIALMLYTWIGGAIVLDAGQTYNWNFKEVLYGVAVASIWPILLAISYIMDWLGYEDA
jgi:phage-related holin